jgi:beta-galactosidase beta subunit
MIEFTKVWNDTKEDGKKVFKSKKYYYDPRTILEGMEGCKLTDGDKEVDCTKIFHSGGRWVTLMGTPKDFMQLCKDANVVVCLLSDLYAAGITIKQFLEENERKNGVSLT